MSSYKITPKVDATQEFIEIANDFSNPLDLVREAISNSYDAKATKISISFDVEKVDGEDELVITLKDDGTGMDKNGLQSFFDLGNSLRRGYKGMIGEKGHGTKVFFNSKKIEVITSNNGKRYHAEMDNPYRKLHNRKMPEVQVIVQNAKESDCGTNIIIRRYNNNRMEKFTHDILKDYIMWFTKHGSVENVFIDKTSSVELLLKGLDKDNPENIKQGHVFPNESININQLISKDRAKAHDNYCKRITKKGNLKNYPHIHFEAVFSIEGKRVKYDNNPMLRRPGYSAPNGAYTIQDRYGLWLCKDHIPIQRKNEWITTKGSEYTKFHAFFNCQDLRLTANRSSIENTPSETLQDVHDKVQEIYNEIINSDDWTKMDWLEEQSISHQTIEKEKNLFKWRINKVNKAKVALHNGVTLVEPERESGVYSMFMQLAVLEKSLFPFIIIDYDTHEGIDVIAKGDKTTSIKTSKLYYVEFKRTLGRRLNHSFENTYSIVCWDTDIMHDDTIMDIDNEERKMEIIPPANNSDYTMYFLVHPKKVHRIEVFVLKQYLEEKLNIIFKPRKDGATY